ncbi:cerebellin 11 [Chanos chanos]|uniref:Cerebellin 11 n=1 Tax=Chanos chanos TaxID=29144 RepID=A0A6J2VT78_CHACN|nr:complement C1q-like protein 2 [Chanos chanos]
MDGLPAIVSILLVFLSVEPALGQKNDSDIIEELKELKHKLNDVENQMTNTTGKLQEDLKDLEQRLNATEKQLEHVKTRLTILETENKDLKTRLNATEKDVEDLKKNGSAGPKVAFSASLTASGEVYKGHSKNEPTLVYKRIFANMGNAYNANTGIFKAPVKGVYFFSFSTFGYGTHLMGAILTKNGHHMVSSYDHKSSDSSDTGGNAVVLVLEAGEQVAMKLWENSQVFDNLNGHTTFSGFLIFPL